MVTTLRPARRRRSEHRSVQGQGMWFLFPPRGPQDPSASDLVGIAQSHDPRHCARAAAGGWPLALLGLAVGRP